MAARRFYGMRRMQALVKARECWAIMVPPDDAVAMLMEDYQITEKQAQDLVAQGYEDVCRANSNVPLEKAKALLLNAARDTYTQARANGKPAAAITALKFMAQLHRITEAENDLPAPQLGSGAGDEFESRTAADNKFYAQHGCWPEEYKPPKKQEAPRDPLEKLH